MMKNVAAIGLGLLDGLGKRTGEDFQNAKAALFTKAAHEIVDARDGAGRQRRDGVGARGDRRPARDVASAAATACTASSSAPASRPKTTLRELEAGGLTVEGVDSTRDVAALARRPRAPPAVP